MLPEIGSEADQFDAGWLGLSWREWQFRIAARYASELLYMVGECREICACGSFNSLLFLSVKMRGELLNEELQ